MSDPVALVWGEAFMAYRLSEDHPLQPLRVKLTVDLIRELGLDAGVEMLAPRLATEAELELCHSAGYGDPDVLTISLHETGRYLFPGTGFPDETGAGDARGSSANLPLAPYTWDAPWLAAFDAVVPPLVRAFRPTVLVTQDGCDTHALDP